MRAQSRAAIAIREREVYLALTPDRNWSSRVMYIRSMIGSSVSHAGFVLVRRAYHDAE